MKRLCLLPLLIFGCIEAESPDPAEPSDAPDAQAPDGRAPGRLEPDALEPDALIVDAFAPDALEVDALEVDALQADPIDLGPPPPDPAACDACAPNELCVVFSDGTCSNSPPRCVPDPADCIANGCTRACQALLCNAHEEMDDFYACDGGNTCVGRPFFNCYGP